MSIAPTIAPPQPARVAPASSTASSAEGAADGEAFARELETASEQVTEQDEQADPTVPQDAAPAPEADLSVPVAMPAFVVQAAAPAVAGQPAVTDAAVDGAPAAPTPALAAVLTAQGETAADAVAQANVPAVDADVTEDGVTRPAPETPASSTPPPDAPAVPPAGPAVARAAAPTVLTTPVAGEQPAATAAATSVEAGATSGMRAGQDAPAVDAGAAPTQAPVPVAVTAPAASTPTVAPAAPAAATSAPAEPLATQLTTPLASLRTLPEGEHELSIAVDPETFGPVRVVARISSDGVSLHLFGGTDAGREALKHALPDLRRDLAATGMDADLQLGTDSGPSQESWGEQRRGGGRTFAVQPAVTDATGSSPTTSHLDVRAGGVDILV